MSNFVRKCFLSVLAFSMKDLSFGLTRDEEEFENAVSKSLVFGEIFLLLFQTTEKKHFNFAQNAEILWP